jgi:GH43 family beta-xylosidase
MTREKSNTYSNPFWPHNFPDPFLLKVRGRYFAYATEAEENPASGSSVFPILTSTDMVSWHEVGKAMPALSMPYYRYWAPEVTEYNGQFFLYYAVHTEEFVSSIRVAVAERPQGPFIDSGHDLTSFQTPWAIDPHVFRDQDGQWYLYMTIEYLDSAQGFVGSGNAVDRLLNPFTLQGNLTRVTPPSQAWQLFEAQRQLKGGIDWYTVEGPTVIKHRGRYYEMFSGGCYYRDNYAVSYATSDTPMGNAGMHDISWQDWQGTTEQAVLIQGDRKHFISPGHNSLVLGPNNAEQYIAYHAIQQDMRVRVACLDRLFWHGDDLWTPAPTHTPQPAPSMPRIHELFEQPELSSSWQPLRGNWHTATSEVVQEDDKNDEAVLVHRDALSLNWLLEVNLRHIAGNGSYGILLRDDSNEIMQLTITADAQVLWSDFSSGEALQTLSLSQGVTLQAWHQLLLTFSGSVLTVCFDGVQVGEFVVTHVPQSFALYTHQASAAFTAVSLTNHFRDEFLQNRYTPALLGWNRDDAQEHAPLTDWQIREGTLVQTILTDGKHIVLKGSHYSQYEFGATMKLQQGIQSAFGLVMKGREKVFLWFAQKQLHWQLIMENSTTESKVLYEFPDSFNPQQWHTLRLEQRENSLTIALDGPEVATLPRVAEPVTLGLATRNAVVAFTSVWQTERIEQ